MNNNAKYLLLGGLVLACADGGDGSLGVAGSAGADASLSAVAAAAGGPAGSDAGAGTSSGGAASGGTSSSTTGGAASGGPGGLGSGGASGGAGGDTAAGDGAPGGGTGTGGSSAGVCAATAPSGPSGDWTLAFCDDFTGSALDASKWAIGFGWGRTTGWTQEYCSDKNVSVSDGLLRLALENRAEGGKPYTAGCVNTRGKFYQEFGYFEARIRMAKGKGFLNAFWSKRNDESWPPEIDFVEVIGADTKTAHLTVHYNDGSKRSSGGTVPMSDLSSDFHVFATQWTPSEVIWYIDGVEVRRYTGSGVGYLSGKPFYLMLNVHIGADWPGYPDSSTPWPSEMTVDWVRAWKRP